MLRPILAVKFIALIVIALAVDAGHSGSPKDAAPKGASRPAITAYFVTPGQTVKDNELLLLRMSSDAITFGYRLTRISGTSLPREVQGAIGSRQAFLYAQNLDWRTSSLGPADKRLMVEGDAWTVLDVGRGSAVVFRGSRDSTKALNQAGNHLGAKTIIGLPVPTMGSQDGLPYLPDTSYARVLNEFTKRFVAEVRAQGADGYYQSTEMPLTDTRVWDPVRRLYADQNRAVNSAAPGALVITSPYLESRLSKAHFTPARAARGARMLMGTAQGVNLVIAPQDGLGTGSTALKKDGLSGRVAPLEDYLHALQGAVGRRLWTNVELMRPGPDNSRSPTSRTRVEQQLSTELKFATTAIAFMWHDSTREVGAVAVERGMGGLSRGLGHTET